MGISYQASSSKSPACDCPVEVSHPLENIHDQGSDHAVRHQTINRVLLKTSATGLDVPDELSETASEHQGPVEQSIRPEAKEKIDATHGLLQPPSMNASGSQIPQIPQRSPSSTPTSMESYLDVFHTLRWTAAQRLMASQADQQTAKDHGSPHISVEFAPPRKTYDQATSSLLEELSKTMNDLHDPQKRTLYKRCPVKTLEEVKKTLTGMTLANLDHAKVINMKKDLFSAAVLAFQVFLPLEQQGSICSKYWGSLHRSITVIILRHPASC